MSAENTPQPHNHERGHALPDTGCSIISSGVHDSCDSCLSVWTEQASGICSAHCISSPATASLETRKDPYQASHTCRVWPQPCSSCGSIYMSVIRYDELLILKPSGWPDADYVCVPEQDEHLCNHSGYLGSQSVSMKAPQMQTNI